MFTILIKTNKRRGVTLLIVLALMVMFAMLVTTFMVIVTHNRRTSELYARILAEEPTDILTGSRSGNTGIRHNGELDTAIQLLLRGSKELDNVLAPYSLLENLYGHPQKGFSGHFPVAKTDEHLLRIEIATPESNTLGNVVTAQFADTNHPLHNKSTFVFDVQPHDSSLLVVPFAGLGLPEQIAALNQPDCRLVFNAPPFSGRETENPFALFPNFLAPKEDGTQEYRKYLNDEDVRMNPDYTAPDFRSLFLAWNDINSGSRLVGVKPSFHDPKLIQNHWDGSDFNELRKFVLRPLPTDHPPFTGSNPAATVGNLQQFLTVGPWDVDGDGDGKADSLWFDIGLPVQYDARSNSHYKPLVSIHVIDMDSRINANTLGNLAQLEPPPANPENTDLKGAGFGTAEWESALLTKTTLGEVLSSRYGSSGTPGLPGGSVPGINRDAYTKGGLQADWHGTSPIMFDALGNRVVTPSAQANPYSMNPYNESSGDDPFQVADDLKPFLHSIIEVGYKSGRFRELLDPYHPTAPALTLPELRYNFTTRSSSIPAAAAGLYNEVLALCHDKQDEADALWMLLPEEVRRGGKVNLNRLTLSPIWDVHWKEGATTAEKTELLKAKVRFAQEMFCLCQVLFRKTITEKPEMLERLAQWSVNLVDFIDPDDVMTPFIFKTGDRTFDNTDLIDALLAGSLTLPSDCTLIWGFEKSEVVMTETFAVHDRRVELRPNGRYAQTQYPRGSLVVELYRQGNPQRDYQASSLVDPTHNVLDLAQRTGINTGDYIWRIAIGEPAKTFVDQSEWNDGTPASLEKNALFQLLTPDGGKVRYPQFSQWATGTSDGQYHPDLGAPERLIWFGQNRQASGLAAENENRRRSFYNWQGRANPETSRQYVSLLPNTSLVLAPIESLDSSMTFALDPPKSIELNTDWTNVSLELNVNSPNPNRLSNRQVMLNVSEPLPTMTLTDGYPPLGFSAPGNGTADLYDSGVLLQRGTIPCYKTICLQRLADPNRPHDPIGNPYLTVDWNMIDLHVINTLDPAHSEGIEDHDLLFVSRQWAKRASDSNIWDRTLSEKQLEEKGGLKNDAEFHTFGDPGYTAPFMHFPWHDAPLTNTGELMLVPASAPGRFGVEFHDNEENNNFFGDAPRFGYHDRSCHLNWSDDDIQRLLDFVHVSSRFTGTIQGWTDEDSPKPIYSMQEPGKINLYTMTEEGWNTLRNGRENFPSYEALCKYRNEAVESGEPTRSPLAVLLGLGDVINDSADNPYTALENVTRLSDVTTTQSNVFAVWITVGYFQVEKFENLNALKTKYPVLAHINSEALFEAVYPDGYVLGAEMGLDDGSVKRHRAFYLIDRSIPVGFRRGEELNTNNVIIWETMLE